MPSQILPNGSAGSGRFTVYAALGWHKPFNLHTIRPYYFWRFSVKFSLSHFPNKAKIVPYGYYLDLPLKMAHRGNTGSHSGKRMLI